MYKTFLIIGLMAQSVLAYDPNPKITPPETILRKFDRIVFKGLNLSIRGLNELSVTRRLKETSKTNFEGYTRYNVSSHRNEIGLHFNYRWK